MVRLQVKHPMKYSEKGYNENQAECPTGMSISQSPHPQEAETYMPNSNDLE